MRQHELDYKHEMMAADTFSFLRATFYRWAELAPQALPDVADGVRVLAVGDLHVENYGTWRDVEGRLVWGVSDFDEANARISTRWRGAPWSGCEVRSSGSDCR